MEQKEETLTEEQILQKCASILCHVKKTLHNMTNQPCYESAQTFSIGTPISCHPPRYGATLSAESTAAILKALRDAGYTIETSETDPDDIYFTFHNSNGK